MIDVSEIIFDADLAQTFTVMRSSGRFAIGGWQEDDPTSLDMMGVVTVADAKTLNQVPEGDRLAGAMLFYSIEHIFTTRNGEYQGTSDIITWCGDRYRVAKVWPYRDYGYVKAYAVRMDGD